MGEGGNDKDELGGGSWKIRVEETSQAHTRQSEESNTNSKTDDAQDMEKEQEQSNRKKQGASAYLRQELDKELEHHFLPLNQPFENSYFALQVKISKCSKWLKIWRGFGP